jgi:hypothetical protein
VNRDLGVWTSEDCALVLIDYQKDMFEAIRSETDAQLAELNVRWLESASKGSRSCQKPSPATMRRRLSSPPMAAISDRLAVLDGSLRVESPTDCGTVIAACIPVG